MECCYEEGLFDYRYYDIPYSYFFARRDRPAYLLEVLPLLQQRTFLLPTPRHCYPIPIANTMMIMTHDDEDERRRKSASGSVGFWILYVLRKVHFLFIEKRILFICVCARILNCCFLPGHTHARARKLSSVSPHPYLALDICPGPLFAPLPHSPYRV